MYQETEPWQRVENFGRSVAPWVYQLIQAAAGL